MVLSSSVVFCFLPRLKGVGIKLILEVEVIGIIEGSPQTVLGETSYAAGIDKTYFDRYYTGHDMAVAYVLGRVKRYQISRKLADFGIKTAPQSYIYIHNSSWKD